MGINERNLYCDNYPPGCYSDFLDQLRKDGYFILDMKSSLGYIESQSTADCVYKKIDQWCEEHLKGKFSVARVCAFQYHEDMVKFALRWM